MARTHENQVENVKSLLKKTVANGETVEVQASSYKKASQLILQYGLEDSLDEFELDPKAGYTKIPGYGIAPAQTRSTSGGTSREPGKIRAMCEELILQGVAADEIVDRVKKANQGANTTKGCVSWYKSKMIKRAKESGDDAMLAKLRRSPVTPGPAPAEAATSA